jgi:hypothetical protein
MAVRMKPVTNPMLVGAIELLRAEDTMEHRQMVMEEIMHATLLSPVEITPEPVPDENGIPRITPDHNIKVHMLTAGGKNFFMAFTDLGELQKWQKAEKQNIFGFRFNDYLNMIQGAGDICSGLAINPSGNNLVLSKEMILNMISTK